MENLPYILAIESSCDETSAAVLHGTKVLSNIIATQKIHEKFGGVVPELASRAHQSNIVPVVQQALEEAGIKLNQLHAVAVTQGPGLMGSLLVGISFAKSLSIALQIPLIAVHHMQAHILAHFIEREHVRAIPEFPLLCLTVSGGHTQIVQVFSYDQMEIIGETIDDAAGEAFDKAAKVMGLDYPGGPMVDKHAQQGDASKFKFTTPQVSGFNYSFSGLKTSLLYFLRDQIKRDGEFLNKELDNVCASYQNTLVLYLLSQLEKASIFTGIRTVCLAGGVSANYTLRQKFTEMGMKNGWQTFIPPFVYCTDNAAMIGINAYFKYIVKDFANSNISPKPNWEMSRSKFIQ